MSYEMIAILMFSTMMLMLLTGQRVFGAIGFVAVMAAFFLWGDRGGYDIGFAAAIKTSMNVLSGLKPDSQRYFDHHHSASDTFDAINKRELEMGAATITSLIYLIDKYGIVKKPKL